MYIPPEVCDTCNALYTVSPIRTIRTLNLMVNKAPIVLRLRVITINQQCEVSKGIELQSVIDVAIIQAVLVPGTGFTEIRQLVQ